MSQVLNPHIPLRVTTTLRAVGWSRCSHSHIPWTTQEKDRYITRLYYHGRKEYRKVNEKMKPQEVDNKKYDN